MVANIYFDDMNLEILARESALEESIINQEIVSNMNIYEEMVMFESGEEADSKQQGILQRLAKSISKLIQNIIDYVERFFKSIGANTGEKLSVSDYMNAETTQLKFQSDIKQIYDECEKEFFEAHKFLSLLHRKTGIPPKKLNEWADRISNFVINNGTTVLTVATSVTLGNKIHDLMTDNNKKLKELQKEYDQLSKEMDEREIQQLKDSGHPIMAQMQTVLSGMSTLTKRLSAPFGSIQNKLNQYKASYNKKKK